jgi:hypothetical protein
MKTGIVTIFFLSIVLIALTGSQVQAEACGCDNAEPIWAPIVMPHEIPISPMTNGSSWQRLVQAQGSLSQVREIAIGKDNMTVLVSKDWSDPSGLDMNFSASCLVANSTIPASMNSRVVGRELISLQAPLPPNTKGSFIVDVFQGKTLTDEIQFRGINVTRLANATFYLENQAGVMTGFYA